MRMPPLPAPRAPTLPRVRGQRCSRRGRGSGRVSAACAWRRCGALGEALQRAASVTCIGVRRSTPGARYSVCHWRQRQGNGWAPRDVCGTYTLYRFPCACIALRVHMVLFLAAPADAYMCSCIRRHGCSPDSISPLGQSGQGCRGSGVGGRGPRERRRRRYACRQVDIHGDVGFSLTWDGW
ncbi:hypothetical protein DFH06DRAFT_1168975 [Mycena polygramma]|nr:hypothetical protein DFH06DRAFT_1170953 [Mycena polygramma]KAJ7676759.1 hypothetical protein DFH06DRAFT_1168975 [Mycena polygramma]